MTYLVLIPAQSAEVVERTKYGGSKNAAGAQSATCRNSREKGNLDASAKGLELGGERVLISKAG